MGFFYNKELFAKAGVDASKIKTWDDLLGAVKALKGAGITPITVGGADKWPVSFYWSTCRCDRAASLLSRRR